jgi:hypothetical protein
LIELEHPVVRRVTETPVDLQRKFTTAPEVFNVQTIPDGGKGDLASERVEDPLKIHYEANLLVEVPGESRSVKPRLRIRIAFGRTPRLPHARKFPNPYHKSLRTLEPD